MNVLPIEKRSLILQALVEGNSMRSIVRLTGASKNTVKKLLLEAGTRAAEIHDREMINLTVGRVQVDEIWAYVGKKQKRLTDSEKRAAELGDQYTFVAMDARTKVVPVYRTGKRNKEVTLSFLGELRTRTNNTFQLSSDSFSAYQECVDRVFGNDVHYGQIHKEYEEDNRGEKRYSPAKIKRVTIIPITGQPDVKHISTSYIERQNLTMRMQMRRFTRLTNAFSKKLVYLEAAVALHFFHYNFMRVHQTLRVTPAMEAGITKHVWGWNEFLGAISRDRKVA